MGNKLNPYFLSLQSQEGDSWKEPPEDCDLLCWADPFYPVSSIPEHIKTACTTALDTQGAHYTTPAGLSSLRMEIAKKVKRFNGMNIDPIDELFIVPGADAGLYFSIMPFITPGANDEVVIFDPSYICNFADVELLGAKPVSVELDADNEYAIDFNKLEQAVNESTKMIIMTNPNNPTGRSYNEEELRKLAQFIIKHDLIAVVDQAFEDTVYSGYEMVTLASIEGMKDRTITLFSCSKGMGLCGFRVGYIVAPKKYSLAYQKAMVCVVGATNTIAQYGALSAFKNYDFIKKYSIEFERRTKTAYNIIKDLEGIKCHMPNSGFFLWLDVSAIGDSNYVVEQLKTEAKVIVNGGDGFGRFGKGNIRIVTAAMNDEEKFYAAIKRIRITLELLYSNRYNSNIIV